MTGLIIGGLATCPYCATYAEGKGAVYYAATILMLGLPALLLGSLTLWLVFAARRSRARETAVDGALGPLRNQ